MHDSDNLMIGLETDRRRTKDIIAKIPIQQESESIVRPQAITKNGEWISHEIGSDDDVVIGLQVDIWFSTPSNGCKVQANCRFTVFTDFPHEITRSGIARVASPPAAAISRLNVNSLVVGRL